MDAHLKKEIIRSILTIIFKIIVKVSMVLSVIVLPTLAVLIIWQRSSTLLCAIVWFVAFLFTLLVVINISNFLNRRKVLCWLFKNNNFIHRLRSILFLINSCLFNFLMIYINRTKIKINMIVMSLRLTRIDLFSPILWKKQIQTKR